MIRVSVVIPVYNVEAWLPACLDSVLGQTLREIEVLCIDDASPDGCGRILEEYAARDPRIRVFHLDRNRHQSYGRNLGLSEAKGTYVYFLDSDDMITKEALLTLADAADAEDLDGILFDSDAVYEDARLEEVFSKFPRRRTGTYEDRVFTGCELYGALMDQHDWTVLVQRQFWRRSFLKREGLCFPSGAEHEDELFSSETMLAAKRVRYLDRPFFIHRFRRNSVMTRKEDARDFRGYFICVCRLIRFLEERKISTPESDRTLSNLFERVNYFYPVFLQEVPDPAGCFEGDERHLFEFYRQEKKAEEMAELMDERFWAPLSGYVSIRLYTAGAIARRTCRRLDKIAFPVTGFVVTDPGKDPELVYGRPVIGIDDYTPAPGEIVLVAVRRELHREISAMLCERGIPHYLYAAGELEGPFGGPDRSTEEK